MLKFPSVCKKVNANRPVGQGLRPASPVKSIKTRLEHLKNLIFIFVTVVSRLSSVVHRLSSVFVSVNLGSIYLSNQFNLGNLWLKINQSKHINYAKQSQFIKSQK
jgi:hypothetical protein